MLKIVIFLDVEARVRRGHPHVAVGKGSGFEIHSPQPSCCGVAHASANDPPKYYTLASPL